MDSFLFLMHGKVTNDAMSVDKLVFSETFSVVASSSSPPPPASVDIGVGMFYFCNDEEMTDDSRNASPLLDATASTSSLTRGRRSLDLSDRTMTSAVFCFVKNFIG